MSLVRILSYGKKSNILGLYFIIYMGKKIWFPWFVFYHFSGSYLVRTWFVISLVRNFYWPYWNNTFLIYLCSTIGSLKFNIQYGIFLQHFLPILDQNVDQVLEELKENNINNNELTNEDAKAFTDKTSDVFNSKKCS